MPPLVLEHFSAVWQGLSENLRVVVVHRWATFLVKHLLTPDDHPTLTRFMTFRGCIDRMLLMLFLDFPKQCLSLPDQTLRVLNVKRLRKVQKFFKDHAGLQALRRASLAFQLTGGVEGFMARKSRGDVPAVVALVKGEVHQIVIQRLQRIIGALHLDPHLDLAAALGVLLACASDLLLRLDTYRRFPFKLCLMCRVWSQRQSRTEVDPYKRACVEFIRADPAILDVGCSLPLQELAVGKGDEMASVRWLTSP